MSEHVCLQYYILLKIKERSHHPVAHLKLKNLCKRAYEII